MSHVFVFFKDQNFLEFMLHCNNSIVDDVVVSFVTMSKAGGVRARKEREKHGALFMKC